MHAIYMLDINPVKRGIIDCIHHIRWCFLVRYIQYLAL